MAKTRVTAPLVLASSTQAANVSIPEARTARLPVEIPERALHFSSDLVHEGKNNNGDVFLREEMARAWRSLVGKPIDTDHDVLIGGVVGQIYDARYFIGEDGRAVIRIAGYVPELLFPSIAWMLRYGVVQGVSMECFFEYGEQRHDGRVLHGVTFAGMGLTRMPADVEALIDMRHNEQVQAQRRDRLVALTTAIVAKRRSAA